MLKVIYVQYQQGKESNRTVDHSSTVTRRALSQGNLNLGNTVRLCKMNALSRDIRQLFCFVGDDILYPFEEELRRTNTPEPDEAMVM